MVCACASSCADISTMHCRDAALKLGRAWLLPNAVKPHLANNNLSGSLPISWGTNSLHIPRFKRLQWLALLPGALLSVVPVMTAAQSLMQRYPG